MELDAHTRTVLRQIVRRVHFSKTQQRLAMPDKELDKWIDAQVPETLESLQRLARVGGLTGISRRITSAPGMSVGGRVKRKPRLERFIQNHALRLQDTLIKKA